MKIHAAWDCFLQSECVLLAMKTVAHRQKYKHMLGPNELIWANNSTMSDIIEMHLLTKLNEEVRNSIQFKLDYNLFL